MYRAIVKIEGYAPLSQSRQHFTEMLEGESMDSYDIRTWREKANYDERGMVYVPAVAFKQALDAAAKRLAIPDPDNKRANFTKYFVSDVVCENHMSINIHRDQMPMTLISANVDGIRGSGKRVPRRFPQTQKWGGETSFTVMEEKITPAIFERVFECAGKSIGVGQFRPERGGLNGRFKAVSFKYEKI